MSSSIDLYRKYQKLDYDTQVGIKIAALIFEPFELSYFMKAINAYKAELSQQNIVSNYAQNLLNQFVKEGYLMTIGKSQYRISPTFSNFLLDETFQKDEDSILLMQCVRTTEPPVALYFMRGDKQHLYRVLKEMHFYYYQDRLEPFQNHWNTIFQYHNASFTQIGDLVEVFFPKLMDKSRINKCPPKIRTFLLKNILFESKLLLTSNNEYQAYVFDHLSDFEPNDREDLAEELAENAMLRGDFERVKVLFPLLSEFAQAFHTAWFELVQDNNTGASIALLNAQKAIRKLSGNSKSPLLHLAALIQYLIWLQGDALASSAKIEANFKAVTKYHTVYGDNYWHFLAVAMSLKNQKKEAQVIFKEHRPSNKTGIHQFFYFLTQFWVDRKAVDNDANLIPFYRHLQKNGYNWLASEILAILGVLRPHDEVLQGELEKLLKVLKTKPLVDIVPHVDEWESALNAMIGLSGMKTAVTAKENDSRLVWLLDFESKEIQPKEQVFGKSGWSGGRNVALTRVK
ncbi:MAG: hypothetical protein RLZZ628_1131, partial [Bacteroidota bacterium]